MKNRLFFRLLILAVATVFTVTSCKDYDDDITRLDKSLSELKSSIPADKSAQIDQLAKDIVTYKGDLDAAKKKLADLEAGKASQEALEAAKKEVLEKAVKVAAFEDYKKGLEENLKKIKEELKGAATQDQIKALEEIYATKEDLSDEVSTLNGLIEAAEGRISTIEGLNLKDEIEKIQTNIKEIKDLKDKLEKSLPDLDKLKGEIKGDYDKAIEKAINKLKDEINLEELNKNINSKLNDDQVAKKIKDALDGYKTTVEKIYAEKIKTLEEKIGMNIEGVVYTSFYHLKSLVFYPELYVDGVESIVFHPLIVSEETVGPTKPICPVEGEVDCFKSFGEEVTIDFGPDGKKVFRVISPNARAMYNVNPSGLKLEMIDKDNLDVTSHAATFRAGGIEDEVENPFSAEYVDLKNGKLVVDMAIDLPKYFKAYGTMGGNRASSNTSLSYYVKDAVLALQVPHSKKAMEMLPEGADSYVTSDYTRIVFDPITGVDIAKKKENTDLYTSEYLLANNLGLIESEKDPVTGAVLTHRSGVPFGPDNAKTQWDGVNIGWSADVRIIRLVEGETINLADSVQAVGLNGNYTYPAISLADYGLTWKFDLLDGDGKEKGNPIVFEYLKSKTDQQKFIELINEETGEVKASVYGDDPNNASIDRTPIVRVRIMKDDCTVSYAFIKILIVKKSEAREVVDLGEKVVKDAPTGCNPAVYQMTTEEVNRELYNNKAIAGGMKNTDFINVYVNNSKVEVKDEPVVGTFTWIKDVYNGRTTYRPLWRFDQCDVPWCEGETEKEIENDVYITPYDPSYPVLKFTFKATFKRPNHNLTEADFQKPYWDAGFTTIEHHSQRPTNNTDNDPNNFTYKTNINGAFKTFDNGALKLDNKAFTNYDYIFAPAGEQIDTDGEGRTITPIIKADGKELWAKMNKDVKVMFMDENGKFVERTLYKANTEEKIATITPHTTTNMTDPEGEDWLTYEQGDLAKYLLNKGKKFMFAKLKLRLDCGCDELLPITVKGKESFTVVFRRPINAIGVSNQKFKDGAILGRTGSIIDMMKAIDLSDWYGDKFNTEGNENFKDFYGVKSARLSVAKVQWNANGKIEPIPSTVHVNWLSQQQVKDLNADFVKDEAKDFVYGGISYESNNITLTEDVSLFIPIQVEYKWGLIVSETVEVKVIKTDNKK